MLRWAVLFLLAVGLTGPSALSAQLVAIAPQVSFGDEADLGFGVRAAFEAPSFSPNIEVHLGFDLFFPDDPPGVDIGYMEANANVIRYFRVSDTPTLLPYLGAGFNFGRTSQSQDGISFSSTSNTELGVNMLGGVRFNLSSYDPFLEVRLQLGGGEQAVATTGLRFPI
ncbi:MAG: hypothetical protein ACR2QM_19365 [Longimicrobiales bacterium]